MHLRSTRRRTSALTLAAASAAFSVALSVTPSLASPPAGYELTFADEFNGAAIDTNVWRILPSRPNVSIVNGNAEFLTVELTPPNGSTPGTYQEGWIDTINFRQVYGYYEVRMRIGDKSGLNNAFWLNTPTELANADNTHDRLEIDIIEAHYPDPVSRDYTNSVKSWETGSAQGHGGTSFDVGDLSANFNTYAVEWRTDNSVNFILNGTVRNTVSAVAMRAARNTIPLEVILSSKVLFDGFAGTVDPNVGGTKMIVDYVRVYDQPGFIGTTSNNWGTGTNWGDGDWDRTEQAALFNRAVPHSTIAVAGVDKLARDIVFDNPTVPALTFIPRSDFPSAILRLGRNDVGGITINEDVVNSQTFNIPIAAQGDLTLSNFASSPNVKLIVNSPIRGEGANRELTFLTTSDIDINGPIESTIAVVQKYLTGSTRLAGDNNHTGQTLIKRGTLNIASPTALGNASAGTIVSSGATLGLSGGFTYNRAEPLQISGSGAPNRTGAIERLDASNVSIESMPITLAANATVSNPFNAGSLNLGAVNIPGGFTLTFTGSGTTEVNGNITGSGRFVSTGTGTVSIGSAGVVAGEVRFINGGTLQLRSDIVDFQSTFRIENSKVDLLDNAFILNDTLPGNDIATVRGMVRTGFNNGAMNGNGILTSLTSSNLVIGFADNAVLGLSSFLGVPVNANHVLVRATRTGDTNLDGFVNFIDLLALARNYNANARTWTDGDFNYDLRVDFADLLALARNYGSSLTSQELASLPADFQNDFARALAVVPEPAILSTLTASILLLRRQRRSA